jgi:hypothetical protein
VPEESVAHHCPHKVALGLIVVSTTGERLRRPMMISKPHSSCHKISRKKTKNENKKTKN